MVIAQPMRPAIVNAAGFAHRLKPFIDGLPEIIRFLVPRHGAICEAAKPAD